MRAFIILPFVALASGCAQPDEAVYPSLLPLDQLNAPPGIPAHAADAASNPDAVGAALKARAAQAAAQGRAIEGPVADTSGLAKRAEALRARAKALRAGGTVCPPGTSDPMATGCQPR